MGRRQCRLVPARRQPQRERHWLAGEPGVLLGRSLNSALPLRQSRALFHSPSDGYAPLGSMDHLFIWSLCHVAEVDGAGSDR